jgi:hypothetical protein
MNETVLKIIEVGKSTFGKTYKFSDGAEVAVNSYGSVPMTSYLKQPLKVYQKVIEEYRNE